MRENDPIVLRRPFEHCQIGRPTKYAARYGYKIDFGRPSSHTADNPPIKIFVSQKRDHVPVFLAFCRARRRCLIPR